jgi:hypothetical protein
VEEQIHLFIRDIATNHVRNMYIQLMAKRITLCILKLDLLVWKNVLLIKFTFLDKIVSQHAMLQQMKLSKPYNITSKMKHSFHSTTMYVKIFAMQLTIGTFMMNINV